MRMLLITDRLLSLLQAVVGPSPLDSVHYAKLEGPRWVTGRPRLSRGALGQNLNAYNKKARRPGTEEKGLEQTVLETQKSSRELHPYL